MIRHAKYVSLTVLILQTTAMVLVLRYSRTVPQSGPRYLASTTIVVSEILKIFCCLVMTSYECGWSYSILKKLLQKEIWQKKIETLKLVVPAGLYTIQNNLLFLALSVLDAATYQVTYQLKILTTAMFSVIILHKRLEITQWLALVLLMIGVALVQFPSADSSSVSNSSQSISSQFLGLFVVFIACFSSGFSGVYFEKLLKSSAQSLWIRNIQLAVFSIIFGVLAMVMQDFPAVLEHGFFQGYYTTTWIVIFLQAFGGLVVSTVIKYADNILKGFATSISIVLSTIASYYLLDDFKPTNTFFMGATIVITATMLYGYPVKKTDKYSSGSQNGKLVER
ncbi:UDP-N-acetylglucosamine transporter-like [Uloborus diversus]|uniref:UDP-N-acetylglucosamine transporter-like n=1 Tax=Uloborus diversus TaxID=327109 RepID=UPI00240A524D|nr:UDP-N-acetylglucosamine transporter-like [Uloborus diversus]XP_054717794.1 UDP-N-acetylglucosamine transporter-like [Uloborus diversus]